MASLQDSIRRALLWHKDAAHADLQDALRQALGVLRLFATEKNLDFYRAMDGSYHDYLDHNAGIFRIAEKNQAARVRELIRRQKQATKATGRSRQVFKKKRRS